MKITRPQELRPQELRKSSPGSQSAAGSIEIGERRPHARGESGSLIWTSAAPMTEEEIATRLHGRQFEDEPRALRARALYRFQPRHT